MSERLAPTLHTVIELGTGYIHVSEAVVLLVLVGHRENDLWLLIVDILDGDHDVGVRRHGRPVGRFHIAMILRFDHQCVFPFGLVIQRVVQ